MDHIEMEKRALQALSALPLGVPVRFDRMNRSEIQAVEELATILALPPDLSSGGGELQNEDGELSFVLGISNPFGSDLM